MAEDGHGWKWLRRSTGKRSTTMPRGKRRMTVYSNLEATHRGCGAGLLGTEFGGEKRMRGSRGTRLCSLMMRGRELWRRSGSAREGCHGWWRTRGTMSAMAEGTANCGSSVEMRRDQVKSLVVVVAARGGLMVGGTYG